ncbi:ABC transporter permease [Bacteroidota bacterium]
MLLYNLKIAFRNILKNKGYSFLNIVGLAVGMMSSVVIVLWIIDETNYDTFHQDADRIFRIAWMSDNPQTRTPHPITYSMVADFPEVENAVSISPIWGDGLTRPMRTVKQGEITYEENGIFSADTTFFQVFSFKMVKGNPKTALKDVGGLVITEEMAEKYFPDEDPLGKSLIINFGMDIPFMITGVIQNIPDNSHFHFDFLVSYNTTKSYPSGEYYEWADFGHYNYIKLTSGANPGTLEKEMMSWVGGYREWSESALEEMANGTIGFRLQPLTSIHLHSDIRWELEANGDIYYVYIFSVLAVFILVIACINFMNLATARATSRATEIGLKKIVGASRSQLIWQFYGEAFLASLAALIIGLVLFEMLTPIFNSVTGKSFSLNYSNPQVSGSLLILLLLCSVAAGTYPALILSGFKPSKIIKGSGETKKDRFNFRRVLVIFQFAISAFLIIGSLIIAGQLKYLQNRKLGFNSDQVIVVPIKDTLMQMNYESAKAEFLRNPSILNASAVSNIPGRRFNQNPIRWKRDTEENYESTSEYHVDHDFFKTLDIKIIEGRDFKKNRESDFEFAYIINEAAASLFDWENPVNEEVIWYDDEITREGRVIGIVENFHFQSLHKSIEPLLINVQPDNFNYYLVKIRPENIQESIAYLKSAYEKIDPNNDFTYFFMNDDFSALYKSEERVETIFTYFTFLAIIISCLGLFGLSSYDAERRTKEIGIRKVNGATVWGIVSLLSKDFTKWVIVAYLIACPFGWIIMNKWLENFAYQLQVSWSAFLIAGTLAILIGLLTVSFHSFRAARKNPVDVLRYE